MRIKTMVGESDDSDAHYKYSAHIYIEHPYLPIPLKIATGIFHEEEKAKRWASDCMVAMEQDQSWAEAGDSIEMDTWIVMHLPPDDFEREHAQ